MTSLNDVCLLIEDCLHSTATTVDTGYPVIRTPNIGKGRLLLDNVDRVTKQVYDERNIRAIPQTNDLILAREASAGNVAIIKEGQTVCLGQRTVLIRPNPVQVNPSYLCYYLLAPTQQYNLLGTANGATVPHVNMSTIRTLKLDLPPITIQNMVAETISSYDDLIENNQKQIKLLEEAAARLYKEWFVDLRFPGYETTKFVDGLPEGWANACFNDICVLVKDCVSPKDILPNTPYIGLEHMPRKSICLNEWIDASIVNSNKFIFRVNDILFGKIRPYFHKVGFAQVDGVASTDAIILRAKQDMFGLLLMTASSDVFVKYTYTTCKEGSKMPRADWDEMKAYRILIPDPKVLKMFDEQIRLMTQMIKTKSMQSLSLCQARDKLLPKLMSGEIEV